ncbi:DUF2914 domain-containing protein [Pseudoalteromonas distincta]|uniref:DUF5924 family protein n=1 Tax=Pseudoalteromonas distincta TaxID=77608 RepID=UPI0011976DE6|nr:DUF5924 family protein [Pseudoalteromonas elyakovii]TVU77296.1 DUF2914 domain-containing protein [Pseudoalteromonas elyakovii]|tara:strand:+ start:1087 stop:2100 length:1014 start_codon:yes stop_codon:yes gene_type:complete
MDYCKNIIAKFISAMQKRPGLLAVLAFLSGVASFALVDRKESFSQFIALFLLISWLWLIIDNWLRDKVEEKFGVAVSPNVMRFALQMVQQESLFFALPFFLAVTQWDHPQAIFTSLIALCAVISVIDPFYYKKLARNRTLFSVFHNFALFVVLLVTLPILLNLTTSQSLAAALVTAVVITLPSLNNLMPNARWWRFPILVLILCALSTAVWQLRSYVPPAALRLTDITLAHEVDLQHKKPVGSIKHLDSYTLHHQGLYSWTAVKAPRGLNEKIFHVWLHNKKEVDRITLNINGGRELGYRAWTHKVNFPKDSVGKWQVKVVTESGQLIGLTKFTVTP